MNLMNLRNENIMPTPYDRGPAEATENALYICAGCGEGICEGDTYYDLIEGDFCEGCIENFRRVAWE